MAFATRSVRAEFGHLWEGEVRHHTFRLESIGTEPIRVDERLDSCGCSSVAWFLVDATGVRSPYTRGAPIEHGSALELDVTFDSRGRTGLFDQPISLYGPFEQGKIELRLAAEIEPLLDVVATNGGASPTESALRLLGESARGSVEARAGRLINLGSLAIGVGGSASILLASRAGPVALRLIGPPVPDAHAELRAIEPDHDGRATRFELAVAIDPRAAAGLRLGSLQLESDLIGGDGLPVVSFVSVHAEVRGAVELSPAYVDVGMLDAGVPWRQATGVHADPAVAVLPKAPKITVEAVLNAPEGDVDVSDWFEGSFNAVDDLAALVLATSGLPLGRFGTFRGSVTLELGLALQPTATLYFGGTATGLANAASAAKGAGPGGG